MACELKSTLSVHAVLVSAVLLALVSITSATWASVGAGAQGAPSPHPTPPPEVFTTRDAAKLLEQIGSGLVEHNRQGTLAAFDLARMTDGQLFEQQITSFLAHTGIIRVHYNGIEAGMEEGNAVATVDFEMDAEPRDENLPPVRKQARLHLVAEKTDAGWKLIDFEPRSFFSLGQP
ncbi:MAG TPA: hypothetical protein VIX19_00410 [Terriglobales bacterium]